MSSALPIIMTAINEDQYFLHPHIITLHRFSPSSCNLTCSSVLLKLFFLVSHGERGRMGLGMLIKEQGRCVSVMIIFDLSNVFSSYCSSWE